MKLIFYMLILFLILCLCNRKDQDKIEESFGAWRKNPKRDTIYKYQFINIPIHKKLDDNYYSNMLIMEGRGRVLIDTVGYFRMVDNKLFYLSKHYKYMKEHFIKTNIKNRNMNQQLFFNFDMPLNSIINVSVNLPFGVCTFILLEKEYNKELEDTIFYCERADTSLPLQTTGGYDLKFMKIGKKVGFTELVFLNENEGKYDVYLPNGNYTWKIISKDTLIYDRDTIAEYRYNNELDYVYKSRYAH